MIITRILDFGLPRALLVLLAVAIALLAPEPQARAVMSWPSIVPTLIAPAIAPLVLLVLIIDLVMVRVMSAGDVDAGKTRRARRIMFIDALAAVAVVVAWLPFFMALGR